MHIFGDTVRVRSVIFVFLLDISITLSNQKVILIKLELFRIDYAGIKTNKLLSSWSPTLYFGGLQDFKNNNYLPLLIETSLAHPNSNDLKDASSLHKVCINLKRDLTRSDRIKNFHAHYLNQKFPNLIGVILHKVSNNWKGCSDFKKNIESRNKKMKENKSSKLSLETLLSETDKPRLEDLPIVGRSEFSGLGDRNDLA